MFINVNAKKLAKRFIAVIPDSFSLGAILSNI